MLPDGTAQKFNGTLTALSFPLNSAPLSFPCENAFAIDLVMRVEVLPALTVTSGYGCGKPIPGEVMKNKCLLALGLTLLTIVATSMRAQNGNEGVEPAPAQTPIRNV